MNQPKWEYELTVRIYVEKHYPKQTGGGASGERLSVDHTVLVQAGGFLELCELLGRFQALAQEIQTESRE